MFKTKLKCVGYRDFRAQRAGSTTQSENLCGWDQARLSSGRCGSNGFI